MRIKIIVKLPDRDAVSSWEGYLRHHYGKCGHSSLEMCEEIKEDGPIVHTSTIATEDSVAAIQERTALALYTDDGEELVSVEEVA